MGVTQVAACEIVADIESIDIRYNNSMKDLSNIHDKRNCEIHQMAKVMDNITPNLYHSNNSLEDIGHCDMKRMTHCLTKEGAKTYLEATKNHR